MQFENRWLILIIVASTLFLIIVDMTVLYTALPILSQELAVTSSTKLWIINIYPLIVAGLLPGAGMVSDRLGHKNMFIAGLIIFGIASIFSAYSPDAFYLIVSRALLAIGAAIMMPATIAIVREVFTDDNERSIAIGIWSAIASGAAALGPVIGGIILEYFWWGTVFLINVPIIIAIIPLAIYIIPKSKVNSIKPYDITGAIYIMLGLVSLVYSLKEMSKIDISISGLLISLAIGALFITLFIKRQMTLAHPLIKLSLFRNSPFTNSIIIAIISMMILSGMELAFTQRLQLVLNFSPIEAGLIILPLPIGSMLAAPLAGVLLSRCSNSQILNSSIVVTLAGIIMICIVFEDTIMQQAFAMLLIGLGLGGVFTAVSVCIIHNTPEENAGMAAAIEDIAWEIGGVLGITLLGGMMNVIYNKTLNIPMILTLIHSFLTVSIMLSTMLSIWIHIRPVY